MNNLILIAHVAVALISVAVGIIDFVSTDKLQAYARKLFTPSIVLVTVSGAALAITGSSLARSCVSGIVTIAALYGLRYFSAKRMSAARVES